MTQPPLVAFVPARGGSKGIPRKNLSLVRGQPLIDFTLRAVLETGIFQQVIVSTDDSEIARQASSFGCSIHSRPTELATDSSRVVDAVLHATDQMNVSKDAILAILQPTSPLRNAKHIHEAVALHQSAAGSPVVSVVRCEHHPYKTMSVVNGRLVPALEHHYLEASRQDLPTMYRANGAIYIASLQQIQESHSLIFKDSIAYEMSSSDSLDVDTEHDLAAVEEVLTQRSASQTSL